MHSIDTVVIGAGHAGVATSHALTAAGVEHVVLERGRIGERWLSERWDSLRLLTPNWMSRLPGWEYGGPDPDGFMTAGELATYLGAYAGSFAAPVVHSAVHRVAVDSREGFRVVTDLDVWRAARVVVATGHCHRAVVPRGATDLSADILQLDPLHYRGPQSVAPDGVLVVGASSTGVQIAAELRAAGHDVVLAVGRHSRLPRRYRGRDIMSWLDVLGSFDRTVDELPARAARSEPSLQLVAGSDNLDLEVLHAAGVQLVGRFRGAAGATAYFADDLSSHVSDAERRMCRVLARIDALPPQGTGPTDAVDVRPVRVASGTGHLSLRERRIGTVVWATGFHGAWPWLEPPVVSHGRITQHRGRTAVPGLYTVGQRFQHRRGSSLIDGARHDVVDVVSDVVTARTHPRRLVPSGAA
ncbi:NAD(P)-binding domain-containing protein [Nocardioides taihuensis]|uniref:NAD(P)-binding domain-containing protein n=1 Tax=Nocardioides taihuensis TaxID=1835606 RepID=A0ABW0BPL7_9ACTN